jgi:hypothetical protein
MAAMQARIFQTDVRYCRRDAFLGPLNTSNIFPPECTTFSLRLQYCSSDARYKRPVSALTRKSTVDPGPVRLKWTFKWFGKLQFRFQKKNVFWNNVPLLHSSRHIKKHYCNKPLPHSKWKFYSNLTKKESTLTNFLLVIKIEFLIPLPFFNPLWLTAFIYSSTLASHIFFLFCWSPIIDLS